jgi:uncharacterized protein (DUF2384 family)
MSESDLRRLYLMHVTLADLFVDAADEAQWLRDPLPILDDLSPLEHMRRGSDGIARVEEMVQRMAGH